MALLFKTRIVQNVALYALLTARISSSQAIELPFSTQVFSFQTWCAVVKANFPQILLNMMCCYKQQNVPQSFQTWHTVINSKISLIFFKHDALFVINSKMSPSLSKHDVLFVINRFSTSLFKHNVQNFPNIFSNLTCCLLQTAKLPPGLFKHEMLLQTANTTFPCNTVTCVLLWYYRGGWLQYQVTN